MPIKVNSKAKSKNVYKFIIFSIKVKSFNQPTHLSALELKKIADLKSQPATFSFMPLIMFIFETKPVDKYLLGF